MEFLSIEEIKAQCRIDSADTSEDELLETFGASAECTICNMINRSMEEIVDTYSELPPPLRQAMLILAADGYKNREATTQNAVNNIPYGVQNLISHYIKLTDRTTDEW